MDRVVDLTEILQREVASYHHVQPWKAQSFYLADTQQQLYVVLDVPDRDHPFVEQVGVVIMARVVGDYVVIDQDTTDRPLVDELTHAGVRRDQIILAYTGETLPETTEE